MNHFTPERLLEFFANSQKHGTVYQASLIVSPGGFDKTALALKVAMLLLCHDKTHAPCQSCPACVKIASGNHPDISIVTAQGKKSITIEQIRDIAGDAHIKPWASSYKLFILEDVHKLREEAANALLKILEEPPDHILFLLTAENEHLVIPTILSRCQVFPVGQPVCDIAGELIKSHKLDPEAARALSALSQGNLDSALDLLTNRWESRQKLFDSFLRKQDPIGAAESLSEVCGQGEEARQKSILLLEQLASFWRDVLVCQTIGDLAASSPLIYNCDQTVHLARIAAVCNPAAISGLLTFLSTKAPAMITNNVSVALIWENIFLRIYQMV